MKNKQWIVSMVLSVLLMLAGTGCALVNTAISAGIAYGIYQATK